MSSRRKQRDGDHVLVEETFLLQRFTQVAAELLVVGHAAGGICVRGRGGGPWRQILRHS